MCPLMEQRAMPTATSSHCSESQCADCQFLGPLPPDRVWLPAGDLPSALNALRQLQEKLSARSPSQSTGDIV